MSFAIDYFHRMKTLNSILVVTEEIKANFNLGNINADVFIHRTYFTVVNAREEMN